MRAVYSYFAPIYNLARSDVFVSRRRKEERETLRGETRRLRENRKEAKAEGGENEGNEAEAVRDRTGTKREMEGRKRRETDRYNYAI